MSEIETFGCGIPSFKLGDRVPSDHYFNEYVKIYIDVEHGKREIFLGGQPANVIELDLLIGKNAKEICGLFGATIDHLEYVKERIEVRDEGGLTGSIYHYSKDFADGSGWFVYAITQGYA